MGVNRLSRKICKNDYFCSPTIKKVFFFKETHFLFFKKINIDLNWFFFLVTKTDCSLRPFLKVALAEIVIRKILCLKVKHRL